MAENQLEFIIFKDAAHRNVALDAMSVNAAQAFSVLLTATINIIKLNENSEGINIQIKSGSAVIIADGNDEQIAEIEQNFNDVIRYRSSNKELVNSWRDVQKLFHANGLEYSANIIRGSKRTSILNTLKTSRTLRAKPASYQISSSIRFLHGKLLAVGGTNPNIHLEQVGKKPLIIKCTEANAKKARGFLYEQINISCWVKSGKEDDEYELCDTYWDTKYFKDFDTFLVDFSNTSNEVEQLKKLHYKSRSYLDVKDYGSFRKFMRLFIHESIDVNILKTLLIITQSFKDHEKLAEMRKKISVLFEKQLKVQRRRKEKNK
ncbi:MULTISPECIES: hypothetical protein [unclassified Mucilaginibacter]|uniref:hypothetical protein n=1 Tax=unclassified Mucilaginibacter TaxID=2617802 RepID=UPI0033937617